MVAAILHLGNIDFGLGEEIDSSVIKDENSRFHLNLAAELLMYAPFLTVFETLFFFFPFSLHRANVLCIVHML